MCNNCVCSEEMYDRCSIVGLIPLGQCCEKCAKYENRLACELYGPQLLRNLDLITKEILTPRSVKLYRFIKKKLRSSAAKPEIQK